MKWIMNFTDLITMCKGAGVYAEFCIGGDNLASNMANLPPKMLATLF